MSIAVVGQSGGPTAAINATLAGVIAGAKSSCHIQRLLGMRHGILGILEDRYTDLFEAFPNGDALDLLSATPSAVLGSCRKKLPPPDEDAALYEEIFRRFEALDVSAFFYIGGNDSMDTVRKLYHYGRERGKPTAILGVPKTIDNDLYGTDHAPGYGSAAKYVATVMLEMARDAAVYPVQAVTIVEIMGRDAGWLTAASALARLGGAGPDLIYLPEVPFSMEGFLRDVRQVLARKASVLVAVSEGIRSATGRYIGDAMQSGAVDVFGHRYLAGVGRALESAVREEIGCKVRQVELNIPQRCAAHCASGVDIAEARQIGRATVEAFDQGATGVFLGFARREGAYAVDIHAHSVDEVAGRDRKVPLEWIAPAGNDILPPLMDYMRPLIQGEAPAFYRDGLPVHAVLETPGGLR